MPAETVQSLSLNRRAWLQAAGGGFGWLSFAALSAWQAQTDALSAPLAPRKPLITPRAKQVIFLYMHGGTSHIDTFDPKPELDRRHGKPLPDSVNTGRNKFNLKLGKILKSPWQFNQFGQSGLPVSGLFSEVAQCADELCVIRSLYGDNPAHVPATLLLHTGAHNFVRPSIGSWVSYGLGTENENLPGFVSICPPLLYGGQRNFGSAFLPAMHQATMIGHAGLAAKDARFQNARPAAGSADAQRAALDLLRANNEEHLKNVGDDNRLESRIQSFELAWRMQQEAPDAIDLTKESEATLKLYGVGEKDTDDYGRQLLMARRLIERGVRFVHAPHSGGRGGRWDQHSNLVKGHNDNAKACDKPIAGLLKDLKSRGLLDETLVVWSTEFGRTPEVQNKNGRGHHPQGYTFWMAGGGVKPGYVHGATDDFGYHAIEDRMDTHDLHATILHLLGLDHERLTYRYSGRDFRLTDVHGKIAHDILA
jgi:hypothetical protein